VKKFSHTSLQFGNIYLSIWLRKFNSTQISPGWYCVLLCYKIYGGLRDGKNKLNLGRDVIIGLFYNVIPEQPEEMTEKPLSDR
jgi:hypothetical protein